MLLALVTSGSMVYIGTSFLSYNMALLLFLSTVCVCVHVYTYPHMCVHSRAGIKYVCMSLCVCVCSYKVLAGVHCIPYPLADWENCVS